MEDLIPLLIFVVIAVINLLKYLAEKGGGKKSPPPAQQERPRREVTGIEEFFEELANKFEPQPTEVPEWPEGRERPDYMQEMEEFEAARAGAREQEETAEIIPMPPPEVKPAPVELDVRTVIPEIRHVNRVASLKSTMKAIPSLISNARSMRIASAPILRSSSAGKIDFPLQKKSDLRRAIIANVVFGPPRAYDTSFDNTIAK